MAMLDDLVDQVAARTGLPRDKAHEAARAAVEFLDQRLPAPVGGQIKPLLEGHAAGLGGMLGSLGSSLGG